MQKSSERRILGTQIHRSDHGTDQEVETVVLNGIIIQVGKTLAWIWDTEVWISGLLSMLHGASHFASLPEVPWLNAEGTIWNQSVWLVTS